MSLEARVTRVERRMDDWDKALHGIENKVTLILKDQMIQGKRIDSLDRKVDHLDKKVENLEVTVQEGFQGMNDRIDKLERLIVTYCTPKSEFRDIE